MVKNEPVLLPLCLLGVIFRHAASDKVVRAYALHGSTGSLGCIESRPLGAGGEGEEGGGFSKHSSGLFLPSNWDRAGGGRIRSHLPLASSHVTKIRRKFTMGELAVEVREAGAGGFFVCSSSVAMSLWLSNQRHLLEGKRLLDLGAGCGLVGLACSLVGVREVVLAVLGSSGGPELIKCLEGNVRGAQEEGRRVTELDWNDEGKLAELGPFDIVVGSDLFYHHSSIEPLRRIVASCVGRGSVFLHVAPPDGSCYPSFIESLRGIGDLTTEEFELEEGIFAGEGGEGGASDVFFLPCSPQFVACMDGVKGSSWRLERRQRLSLTTVRRQNQCQ